MLLRIAVVLTGSAASALSAVQLNINAEANTYVNMLEKHQMNLINA
jgi:uncharacterized protein YukE